MQTQTDATTILDTCVVHESCGGEEDDCANSWGERPWLSTTYTLRIDGDCTVVAVNPATDILLGRGDELQDVLVTCDREPTPGQDAVYRRHGGGWFLVAE